MPHHVLDVGQLGRIHQLPLVEPDLLAQFLGLEHDFDVSDYFELRFRAYLKILAAFVYVVDANLLVVVLRAEHHERQDVTAGMQLVIIVCFVFNLLQFLLLAVVGQ